MSDVIDDVAKRWSEFTEVQRAQIATAIAGKTCAGTHSNMWGF